MNRDYLLKCKKCHRRVRKTTNDFCEKCWDKEVEEMAETQDRLAYEEMANVTN